MLRTGILPQKGLGSPDPPEEKAPISDSDPSLLGAADRLLQILGAVQTDVSHSLRRIYDAGRFGTQAAVNSLLWVRESLREQPLNANQCTLVFIPGFLGPAGSLRQIALEGRKQGFNVLVVGVHLHLQSITTNARLSLQIMQGLITKINRLKNGSPAIPAQIIMLVGFSMGGLVAKKMLSFDPLHQHVAKVILLGTPNNGSALARRFPFLPSCREASDRTFIAALNERVDARYVSISAGEDEFVPRESSILNGHSSEQDSNIVFEEACCHHALTEDPQVVRRFYDLLKQTSFEERRRLGLLS